ncbi:hypothetical protein B0T20DRAFT_178818 [Sordaria brevicollis]|uniref:Uncharacterized protein n=1 Tax=Sordaria brevicollis TaxID=83679 RepID=A0AAE0UE72_SORBR|nr:hypothetical protein B0T20DRAFT_178818 [Sordaria brevicollis]
MAPIPPKRAAKRRDASTQKSALDRMVDEVFKIAKSPESPSKRNSIYKSTLHHESWNESSLKARTAAAAAAAFAVAGNPPPSTLTLERERATRVVLARQYAETSTIPAYYGALDSSPSPGAVVGITLGAVAGFILILFLIYTLINLGGYSTAISESGAGTESVVTRRSRRHRHRSSTYHSETGGSRVLYKSRRRNRSRSRGSTSSAGEFDGGETVEIRRTSKTTRRADHRSRGRSGDAHRHGGHGHGGNDIVLEERHRSRSMGQPQPTPVAERIIIDERRRSTKRQSRRSGAAAESRSPPRPIVVEASEPSHPHERERIVVEEDVSSVSSPPGPPRRRRSSGYREIRPDEFAGGGETLREVRRSRSISRHRE